MCTVQYHEVKKVEGGRGGWEAGLRRLRRLEESTVEKDGEAQEEISWTLFNNCWSKSRGRTGTKMGRRGMHPCAGGKSPNADGKICLL